MTHFVRLPKQGFYNIRFVQGSHPLVWGPWDALFRPDDDDLSFFRRGEIVEEDCPFQVWAVVYNELGDRMPVGDPINSSDSLAMRFVVEG